VLWLCLLGLVALAAIPLQIDRSARTRPDLAYLVPATFQEFSRLELTVADVNNGDKAAFEPAGRMLRWYPVPAENLTVYAIAAALDGQDELAGKAITLSAQRGWRDATAQKAMFDSALRTGQWEVAADRLGALWMSGKEAGGAPALLPQLLETLEGRQALTERLRSAPRWRSNFITWATTSPDEPEVAEFLAAAQRQGVEFSCEDLAAAANRYARMGQSEAAAAVWSGKCVSGTDDAGTSLEFTAGDEQLLGPFDWRYPDHAGLSVELREAQGHVVLDYKYDDPIKAVTAQKKTRFAPGPQRFSILSDQPAASATRSPSLRISCVNTRKTRSRLDLIKQSDGRYAVTIPPESCGTQQISLIVPKGSGTGLRIVLE